MPWMLNPKDKRRKWDIKTHTAKYIRNCEKSKGYRFEFSFYLDRDVVFLESTDKINDVSVDLTEPICDSSYLSDNLPSDSSSDISNSTIKTIDLNNTWNSEYIIIGVMKHHQPQNCKT